MLSSRLVSRSSRSILSLQQRGHSHEHHSARASALAAKFPPGILSLEGGKTPLFIDGKFVQSSSKVWTDVRDPASQQLRSQVPETTASELASAIASSQAAFESFSRTSVLHRQGLLFKYQDLIKRHQADIAESIVLEQGKTFPDAMGDVLRGLQVVESACSVKGVMGEMVEVASLMDTYNRKEPLGVFASVAPFNFPAMIPLWTIPLALLTGNTLLLKPSPATPTASLILAHLASEAGFPAGVLNVVHGNREIVEGILADDHIKGISFVGGDIAGKAIFDKGTASGKRVQANLGAKNHAVLLPDANKNQALGAIIGAFAGASGQRCMALSVLVTVGEAENFLPELVERTKTLKVGSGFEDGVDCGPVISQASANRINKLLSSLPSSSFLLDGRSAPAPSSFPSGNFISPSIVLTPPATSAAYQTEIFGPVLCVVKVKTIDEAIKLINDNKYGNGASIFTRSGGLARKFEKEINVGQVGINVPIPVPLPMFSWSGNKGSFMGDVAFYGPQGLNFYTSNKTITSHWKNIDESDGSRVATSMPTMGHKD